MARPQPYGNERLAEATAEAFKTRTPRLQCVRGHDLTPENVVTLANGRRRCRQCKNDRARADRTGEPYPAELGCNPEQASNLSSLLGFLDRRRARLQKKENHR